jgi:hypothetical protein
MLGPIESALFDTLTIIERHRVTSGEDIDPHIIRLRVVDGV